MSERRVALTGVGLITPYGLGNDLFWTGLMERRTAVRRAASFDPDGLPSDHVGEIPPIDFEEHLDPQKSALWGKTARVAVAGARLAVQDAGIEAFDPRRTGVFLGTGYGGIYELEQSYRTWMERGWKRLKPVTVPKTMANAAASHIAIEFGLRGTNFTCSTACSSGAIAAGLARDYIRIGRLDAVISGGVDILVNASILASWCALRVLSRRNDPTASRPFSADRDGLVMGEGCAVVVLEEMEAARARGARIYGEVRGVGATNDASNIVGPGETGEIEALQMAFEDAGLGPGDIDYINAHGTGTKINDANETRVLKKVFGKRAASVPVSSIKGHIGHAMGAAGAIELATTALCLERQRVPPTLHHTPGDPECDLDYVADGPRDLRIRHALTNSFGFGGQNSVLLLSRVDG